MAGDTQRRKHDLLWATCIVAGFAILLGFVLNATRRDSSPDRPHSQLVAEAEEAVAEGDRAASDQAVDYGRARTEYRRALDLLRSAGVAQEELRAEVQYRIVSTFVKENDYARAEEEVKTLMRQFPDFRREDVALLHRGILAGLKRQGPPDSEDNPAP